MRRARRVRGSTSLGYVPIMSELLVYVTRPKLPIGSSLVRSSNHLGLTRIASRRPST